MCGIRLNRFTYLVNQPLYFNRLLASIRQIWKRSFRDAPRNAGRFSRWKKGGNVNKWLVTYSDRLLGNERHCDVTGVLHRREYKDVAKKKERGRGFSVVSSVSKVVYWGTRGAFWWVFNYTSKVTAPQRRVPSQCFPPVHRRSRVIRLTTVPSNAVWNPWLIFLYYLATDRRTATNPFSVY